MIEKQLLAAYTSRQVVETITQTAEIIVKATLPIKGCVRRSEPLRWGWPKHKRWHDGSPV